MLRPIRASDRPFPWRCGNCGERQVFRTSVPYQTTINFDGKPYEVQIPDLELPKCANCGEVVFDDHAGHQIDQALRQRLGLLRPDQILAGRTQLGLNPKDFAAQLGVSEESISRWESGVQIQSRIADRQIRLFFELPSVRNALNRLERGEPIGDAVRLSATSEAAAHVV
jgi:putative zinc finger/helix-turn-helix YgiT family protein